MLGERECMSHISTATVDNSPHADRSKLRRIDSIQGGSAVASARLSVPPEHAWLAVVEVIGGYWELSRVASRAASSVPCVRLSALPLKPRAASLGLSTSCGRFAHALLVQHWAILADTCGLGTASNGRLVWERSI